MFGVAFLLGGKGLNEVEYTCISPVKTAPMTSASSDQLSTSLIECLFRQKKERETFLAGPVFPRMVSALRDSQEPRSADLEELSYFPERKCLLGWDFADESEIKLFFDVVGDPLAPTVEPASLSRDADCPFQNCTFRHFGLNVWMMFGQGTALVVANDASVPPSDVDSVP